MRPCSRTFFAITFMPDGQVYDSDAWSIVDLADRCPDELARLMALDSVNRRTPIDSPIGELEVAWCASHLFGAATFLRGGVMLNCAVFLPGNDRAEETELLRYYLKSWREFPLVRELCGDKTPFRSAEEIEDRPLTVSVNWSTIKRQEYDHIAHYDLFLGSKYFEVLQHVGTD